MPTCATSHIGRHIRKRELSRILWSCRPSATTGAKVSQMFCWRLSIQRGADSFYLFRSFVNEASSVSRAAHRQLWLSSELRSG